MAVNAQALHLSQKQEYARYRPGAATHFARLSALHNIVFSYSLLSALLRFAKERGKEDKRAGESVDSFARKKWPKKK